jgi:hypothetical protein
MIRRLLDWAVWLSVVLDFLVMVGVYFAPDFLAAFNVALAVHMSIIMFLAAAYTWMKRRAVYDHVRDRARRGGGWLRYLFTFGGSG